MPESDIELILWITLYLFFVPVFVIVAAVLIGVVVAGFMSIVNVVVKRLFPENDSSSPPVKKKEHR